MGSLANDKARMSSPWTPCSTASTAFQRNRLWARSGARGGAETSVTAGVAMAAVIGSSLVHGATARVSLLADRIAGV